MIFMAILDQQKMAPMYIYPAACYWTTCVHKIIILKVKLEVRPEPQAIG